MRKLTWLIAVVVFGNLGTSFGADKTAAKKPAAAKEKAYVCTHCKTASAKPGECPDCKAKLAATNMTYACPKCGAESAKAGQCPKCKTELARNAAVYHCDGCGKDVTTAGT